MKTALLAAQSGIAHMAVVGLLVVASVAGIGTYVYKKSGAQAFSPGAICGRDGKNYPDSRARVEKLQSNYGGGVPNPGRLVIRVSADNKRTCIITVSGPSTDGTKKYMSATLLRRGAIVKQDAGNYGSYAGPVYMDGPCQQYNAVGVIDFKRMVYKASVYPIC